jgi:hypothetical protein
MRAGFEFRWHEMNHSGWARGVAGTFNFDDNETAGYTYTGAKLERTGDPLASLLLGQVDNASFFIGQDHVISERYWSPWINDEIKVNDKLTINLGLRFDYQTPRTERHDRMSTFDPLVLNPVGVPGALRYANASNRSFEQPPKDAWGPRAGFAYRVTNNDVIRGGYGIYYSGVMYDMWISSPTTGFEASPTAPNLSNGLYPAGCTTNSVSSGTCYGWWDDSFPQNRIVFPSEAARTGAFANGTGPLAVSPEGLDLPRYQNWSLSWERQLSSNMLFDISYVGNHGTRLISHSSSAGLGQNMNSPDVLQFGSALLGGSITSGGAQALAVVQAMPIDPADGLHKPYAGFGGNLAQALRPFPQYQGINYRNLNLGTSTYHSLQTKLDKRFTNGLQFRLAYVWSKLIVGGLGDTGNANDNLGRIQNPLNTREKAVSTDDVPHTFIVVYTYQFPFGAGKKFGSSAPGAVQKILGGWGISGIQRYQSGRPLGITMNNDMGGLLFNGAKRPNNIGDGSWSGGKFDPATDRYFDSAAWADPGSLTFGNAPRVDAHARTFAIYNEDVSIIKDTFIKGEQYKIRFEAQFGNILNRTFLCNPNTNFSSGGFGTTGGQCNIPRRIQFGLRFDF